MHCAEQEPKVPTESILGKPVPQELNTSPHARQHYIGQKSSTTPAHETPHIYLRKEMD